MIPFFSAFFNQKFVICWSVVMPLYHTVVPSISICLSAYIYGWFFLMYVVVYFLGLCTLLLVLSLVLSLYECWTILFPIALYEIQIFGRTSPSMFILFFQCSGHSWVFLILYKCLKKLCRTKIPKVFGIFSVLLTL